MAKIILAGGSGFIGQILAAHFTGKDDEVIVLTRSSNRVVNNVKYVNWNAATIGNWVAELENCDVLINLNGKSVNCRYNDKNKKEILDSRVNATRVLGEAIRMIENAPKLWINAASATIYRYAEDRPQDEYTGELGKGFSVDVCKQWEAAFFEQDTPGVRKIGLRIAITLGRKGGVMPYYFNLAKFGLGGRQGSGKQYFSWVCENDVTGVIDFLRDHEELEGVFNVSAPNPVQNHEFMSVVRNVMKMPLGLPATKWMLAIGTRLLSTEAELVLKSRWVVPTRLQEAGYVFKVPYIKDAVKLSSL
ncbi:hypothetical protein SAMN05216490_1055 [Mucilaginibacter mallensis]|uniref:DUF1731 domain-containing protein n=1 Tax=Mucilaginibacter mallensis TaxID=652787 RepID=A0A1H1RRC7_MUCMA|nr:TIGR01777 family oxidoreductase [Mucilaginibacter mallensis]SDS38214.1 hypothetical protein SAMN05216490_1055 [Mucilaginibacter mallensis]